MQRKVAPGTGSPAEACAVAEFLKPQWEKELSEGQNMRCGMLPVSFRSSVQVANEGGWTALGAILFSALLQVSPNETKQLIGQKLEWANEIASSYKNEGH